MKRNEFIEQTEFVSWFRKTFTADGIRIFAIPNGGHRNKAVALKLKCEGVAAGVPDLYVPHWHLWIEMKRADGGVLSNAQKDWRDYLLSIDHSYILAHGKLDAINKVEDFITTLDPILYEANFNKKS